MRLHVDAPIFLGLLWFDFVTYTIYSIFPLLSFSTWIKGTFYRVGFSTCSTVYSFKKNIHLIILY